MKQRKLVTERRKWLRLPLPIPVFVRGTHENGSDFLEFASALNISASGSLIAMTRPLPLSANVLLEIPNAPLAAAVVPESASSCLKARAVRVAHEEGYHLVAFEFENPLLNSNNGIVPKRRKVASRM